MHRFSSRTILAVVIANMIGTGVFTSLGFQLLEIQSGFVLMMLWITGGLAALCGALCYAELGAALPRSGGEYNFLSRILHPAAGFVSGWISASIGFTAPVALAAMTFAAYASSSVPALAGTWTQKCLAITVVVLLATLHSSNHRKSGGLQNLFTLIKVLVIVGFCTVALAAVDSWQPISILPAAGDSQLVLSSAFAVSLIYVSYAYTGWNAATYLSGEMTNPQKELPKVLAAGTGIVMLLYLGLNFVFLKVAPIDAMRGQIEIGAIAAGAVFGEQGRQITGLILAVLLISTVSAMTVAGPRVLQVIGEDFAALRFLSRSNSDGIPTSAIWFQSAGAILFIVFSGFESILLFAGFILALNSFVTIAALVVLRFREPELERPYRVFAYPLPPAIYLMLTGWTITYVLLERPQEAFFGIAVVTLGLLVYWLTMRRQE